MKRTLRLVGVAAMVLLLAASCKKEEKNNGEKQMMTFSAGIEQTGAKTGLLPNGSHAFKQVWKKGDAIRVNDNETVITLDEGCDDKETGTFTGEVTATGKYYAVYPTSATLSGSTATFTLPESQKYDVDSYESDLAPMADYTENNELNFRNLCGLMELSLTGTNVTVTSLELSCDKPICGTATYNIDGSEPLAMANGAGNMVSMDCSTGVPLNGTASFIFVLPPVDKGKFSLKVNYKKGVESNVFVETVDLTNMEISIKASEVSYNNTAYEIGTVTTKGINESGASVEATTATILYTVDDMAGYTMSESGVCYGKNENPDLTGSCQTGSSRASSYKASLIGLSPNTHYYARAYAKYVPTSKDGSDVVVYGNQIDFTTKPGSSVPEGFVDLGTHVGGVSTGKPLYWAKCNLGATNPQDYGNYYSWGFTSPQTGYGIYWGANGYYFGYEGAQGFKIHRYCHNSSYWEYKAGVSFGTTMDNESVLRYSDDVAYTTSNGLNRMPTKEEYDELKQKAYFVWTTNYNSTGKAGCIVYKSFDSSKDHGFTKTSTHTYSTSSDMHIFIPAGGNKDYTSSSALNVGTLAKIWTKSLYTVPGDYDPRYAMAIGLKSNQFINGDSYGNYYQGRCVSLNIRPVREGN